MRIWTRGVRAVSGVLGVEAMIVGVGVEVEVGAGATTAGVGAGVAALERGVTGAQEVGREAGREAGVGVVGGTTAMMSDRNRHIRILGHPRDTKATCSASFNIPYLCCSGSCGLS
jgi:hypothetical protein